MQYPNNLLIFFDKFDVVIKKVPQAKPLFTGIPVKLEEDDYALFKKGKEIFRGTKKEVEELSEKLKKMSDKEAKKYVDDLVNKVVKIITGKYSKRSFDINNCGGKILNLSWKSAKITKEGIEVVKKHLSRLEYDEWNVKMIERSEKIVNKKIPITDFDKRFYTHELREFERYKNLGYENSQYINIPDEVWDNAHAATLEDYKIYEKMTFEDKEVYSLFHPEVQY